jgi:hypothetical protein
MRREFLFVSDGFPSTPHDISRLRQEIPNIVPHVTNQDAIVLDTGFQGLGGEASSGIWLVKKAPRAGKQLSPDDEIRNAIIEKARRLVEDTYSNLKCRFNIVKLPFRHSKEYATRVFHFCCAMNNVLVQFHADRDSFTPKYEGPIPVFKPPLSKFEVSISPNLANFDCHHAHFDCSGVWKPEQQSGCSSC